MNKKGLPNRRLPNPYQLEIASLDMALEQPPRETLQLKCQVVEHQEFYLESTVGGT